jgi:hypothetical protein
VNGASALPCQVYFDHPKIVQPFRCCGVSCRQFFSRPEEALNSRRVISSGAQRTQECLSMDELNLAARQKSRDDIYYSERRDVIPEP